MYTIHYQRYNEITRAWNNHQLIVDSEQDLTQEILRMTWAVTHGKFVITRVGKVL